MPLHTLIFPKGSGAQNKGYSFYWQMFPTDNKKGFKKSTDNKKCFTFKTFTDRKQDFTDKKKSTHLYILILNVKCIL